MYRHGRRCTLPAIPSAVTTAMPAATPAFVPRSRKISLEFGLDPTPMTWEVTVWEGMLSWYPLSARPRSNRPTDRRNR